MLTHRSEQRMVDLRWYGARMQRGLESPRKIARLGIEDVVLHVGVEGRGHGVAYRAVTVVEGDEGVAPYPPIGRLDEPGLPGLGQRDLPVLGVAETGELQIGVAQGAVDLASAAGHISGGREHRLQRGG